MINNSGKYVKSTLASPCPELPGGDLRMLESSVIICNKGIVDIWGLKDSRFQALCRRIGIVWSAVCVSLLQIAEVTVDIGG